MAAHPLAFLRASTGVSHPSYARLVAETHAKLGYGHMAARREKIWRWESGRTVPELTAQLAIAHLHQVPEADVRRLGWPHWLHLAAGDAVLLTRPWTPRGAIDALRDGSRLAERRDLSYLAVTGPFVDTLTRQWTSAAAVRADGRKPGEPHPAEPHPGEPDTVYRARVRVEVLETMASTLPAAVLHPAARNDLSLLTSLVSAAGHDSAATAPCSCSPPVPRICARGSASRWARAPPPSGTTSWPPARPPRPTTPSCRPPAWPESPTATSSKGHPGK